MNLFMIVSFTMNINKPGFTRSIFPDNYEAYMVILHDTFHVSFFSYFFAILS